MKIDIIEKQSDDEGATADFSALIEEEHREMYPNDPYEKLDLGKKGKEKMKEIVQPFDFTNYLILADEKTVGFCYLIVNNPKSPQKVFADEDAHFQIYISKQWRNKGIGSKALEHLLDIAQKKNKSSLKTNTMQEISREFLLSRGGELLSQTVENRLYLENLDSIILAKYISIPQNDTVLDIVTSIPNKSIERYCELYSYLQNNTTVENETDDDYKQTPEGLRMQEKQYEIMNFIWYTLLQKDTSGKLFGLTEMIYNPKEPHRIRQNLTGILPDFRGNGYGKLLKGKLLEHIMQIYPDLKYVYTGNNVTNAPMLHINHQMGFNKEYTRYNIEIKV